MSVKVVFWGGGGISQQHEHRCQGVVVDQSKARNRNLATLRDIDSDDPIAILKLDVATGNLRWFLAGKESPSDQAYIRFYVQ